MQIIYHILKDNSCFITQSILGYTELSMDGGTAWKSANIKDPLSKYTWVLWASGFTLAAPQGSNRIVVRATDKTGKVQTSEVRPPFPDGNTGYHIINV